MSEEKSPGQIAFEAYNESKGGLTYDGKPIPPWSALEGATGDAVRLGWEVAAKAVIADYHAWLSRRPSELIARAMYAVGQEPRGREQALTATKLEEADMWFARIQMKAKE